MYVGCIVLIFCLFQEHASRMYRVDLLTFPGVGLEDCHVPTFWLAPTFWLVLQVQPFWSGWNMTFAY